MKYLSGILLIMVSLMGLVSCTTITGSGARVTEKRLLPSFMRVSHATSDDIRISPGNQFSVIIQAQQNILEVLETKVDNGELKVYIKPNTQIGRHKKALIHITMPEIKGLRLSGSGNMMVDRLFTARELALELTGSGNMELAGLNADRLDAELTGSGSVHIRKGHVSDQELELRGSGDLDLSSVESRRSRLRITGSGDAQIKVLENLKVRIVGSGSVYYSGTPRLETHITGSGEVIPL